MPCNESISRPLDFDEAFLLHSLIHFTRWKSKRDDQPFRKLQIYMWIPKTEISRHFNISACRRLVKCRSEVRGWGMSKEGRNWWWSSYDAFKMMPHDNQAAEYIFHLSLLFPASSRLSENIFLFRNPVLFPFRFLLSPAAPSRLEFIDALLGLLFLFPSNWRFWDSSSLLGNAEK